MEENKSSSWKTVAVSVLTAIAAVVGALIALWSCGSPKSLVKVSNRAEATTTTISSSVGNGGSVTVSVSPDVQLSVNPK